MSQLKLKAEIAGLEAEAASLLRSIDELWTQRREAEDQDAVDAVDAAFDEFQGRSSRRLKSASQRIGVLLRGLR